MALKKLIIKLDNLERSLRELRRIKRIERAADLSPRASPSSKASPSPNKSFKKSIVLNHQSSQKINDNFPSTTKNPFKRSIDKNDNQSLPKANATSNFKDVLKGYMT